jgi:hypothetical protein
MLGNGFGLPFLGSAAYSKSPKSLANALGGSRSREARYEREGLGCWDCCASFSRIFGLELKPRWSTTKVQGRYKTMGVKGQRDLVYLKSATFLQSRTPPTAVTRQSQLVWATRGTETDWKVDKNSFENREVGSVPKQKRQGDGHDIPTLVRRRGWIPECCCSGKFP